MQDWEEKHIEFAKYTMSELSTECIMRLVLLYAEEIIQRENIKSDKKV